jgi:hypothetical protein
MSKAKQVGPNGRALKKDGTERKARTVLTPFQKAARRREQRKTEMRGIGRGILKGDEASAALLDNVGTARSQARQANVYLTDGAIDPAKVAAKVAYHERQVAIQQQKAELAQEWAERGGADLTALESLEEAVGEEIFAFMEDGDEPTAEEVAEICARHFGPEVVAALAAAGDPSNAPFASMQDEDEDEDSDSDTL